MKAKVYRVVLGAILLSMAVAVTPVLNSKAEIGTVEREPMTRVRSCKELPAQSKVQSNLVPTSHLDQKRKSQQVHRGNAPATSLLQVPVECDTALAYLDEALVEMLQLKDTHLIVVARLGTGEVSSRLNTNRLNMIEAYFKRKLPDLKYVMAEGNEVKGLGRVELYVGGRLLHIMPIKKNAKGYCDDPIGI